LQAVVDNLSSTMLHPEYIVLCGRLDPRIATSPKHSVPSPHMSSLECWLIDKTSIMTYALYLTLRLLWTRLTLCVTQVTKEYMIPTNFSANSPNVSLTLLLMESSSPYSLPTFPPQTPYSILASFDKMRIRMEALPVLSR